MSDRILPALLVFSVVREIVHNESVDTAEGQPLPRRGRDGHGDEGDVGIGGLLRTGLRHLYGQGEPQLRIVRIEESLCQKRTVGEAGVDAVGEVVQAVAGVQLLKGEHARYRRVGGVFRISFFIYNWNSWIGYLFKKI